MINNLHASLIGGLLLRFMLEFPVAFQRAWTQPWRWDLALANPTVVSGHRIDPQSPLPQYTAGSKSAASCSWSLGTAACQAVAKAVYLPDWRRPSSVCPGDSTIESRKGCLPSQMIANDNRTFPPKACEGPHYVGLLWGKAGVTEVASSS